MCKAVWKMLNSEYELYNKIVKYSMHNANSTLGELHVQIQFNT